MRLIFALFLSLLPAAAFADLAAHRALYDVSMLSSDPASGLVDVTGKVYYEQADDCTAWTVEHRLVTEYRYGDQTTLRNTSSYAAYEKKDGSAFSFSADRAENGEMAEQLRGYTAGSEAFYTRPDNKTFDMPLGTLLPTAHTEEILRHARAGDKFFSAVLFDGTDDTGPVVVSTFILGTAEKTKLVPLPGFRVRLSVFPLEEEEGQMTPVYVTDMTLHDNGVVSTSVTDYGLFKVKQELSALEGLPRGKCK